MTKILCPVCNSPDSSVLSTRGATRRRQCECDFRYTTVEVVIKNTGSGLRIPKVELELQRPKPVKVSLKPTIRFSEVPSNH